MPIDISEEAILDQLKKQLAVCDDLLKHELGLSDAELTDIASDTEVSAVLNYRLEAEYQQAMQQGQTGKLGRLAISLTAALPLGALVPGLLFSLGIAISLPLHIGLIASFFLLGMGLKLQGLNKEQEDFTHQYKLMAVKKQLLADYQQALVRNNLASLQHLFVDEQGMELITKSDIDNILKTNKPLKAAIEQLAADKTLAAVSNELLKNISNEPKVSLPPIERKFWRDPKFWIKRLFINSLALAATVFGGYIALFKFGYVATALAVFTGAALPYVLAGIGAGITLALLAAIIYGAYKKHVCQQQLARLKWKITNAEKFITYHQEINTQLINAKHLQLHQQLQQATIANSALVSAPQQESPERFKKSTGALIQSRDISGKQPFKERVLSPGDNEEQEGESDGEGVKTPSEQQNLHH